MKSYCKMVIKTALLTQVVILFGSYTLSAQEILQLPQPSWTLSPVHFHIVVVTDDRTDRTTVGRILQAGKTTPLRFSTSPEAALQAHLSSALTFKESNTAPLRFSIDKLFFTDMVSSPNKHKITGEINFKFYREIDGKPYLLYEAGSKPVMTAYGNRPPGIFEKLIAESVAQVFKQFEQWTTTNHNNPYFMNQVVVRFKNDDAFNENKQSDTLRWRKDYHLNWSDFQGKDESNSPYSAQSNCIYTLKTIPDFSNDTLYITEVLHPCFTRKASWVKPDALQDSLLLHEQLHFDLCELYGRKFRQRLKTLDFSLLQFDAQIKSTFESIWKEYGDAQRMYDAETEHGIIREKQNEWIIKVENELEQLREFSVE